MMFSSKSLKHIALLLTITILAYTIPTIAQDIITNQVQEEASKDFKKQLECLTRNIYHESASEPFEGKLAVAQVVLNRANDPNFPKTICEVVYQRTYSANKLLVCQFSWTCVKNLVVHNKYQWEESEIVARKALTEPSVHDTIARTNAMYYHASYINPGWWNLKKVTRIGQHIFYKN
jgi:spore germination cell wall hydrolase CwlJ-like protein